MNQYRINSSNLEARAFRLTSIGALGMAFLGLGFAVITKSEAILLDGFFSLIGFAIALLTQKVAGLVMRPGNEQYPFGYAIFEPMLNLIKGLLIGLISLFALISAISALFTGGRAIAAGVAIAYAGIAAIGCFWLAWRVGVLARRSRSALVAVDAQNWIIDGLISVSVAVAFLVIQFAKGTPIEAFAPYTDPVLVIVLVVSTIVIPIQIIRNSWRQIVGYRPDSQKTMAIKAIIAEVVDETVTWQVRSLEIGRFLYVQIYVVDLEAWYATLAQQDQVRDQLYSRMVQEFHYFHLDVIFTQQSKWLDW